MDRERRKAAVDAYRKRKDAPGIYAIRSRSSGAVFVGQTPDVEAIANRIFFSLRFGSHPGAALQAAFDKNGEIDLAFEVLERIEPPETPYLLRAILKDRLSAWRSRLGAALV
ncbi:GIY-YIG nuclease family protein [Kaistia geumhonensis]|uniref:GIY-YIG nuclease family protein n=1 Tax=Kaistia geumhonensis TaxID=410839 RepID=A0ABU0MB84_9HYPH|nr:GIY-YIG nuclease family protein [Kaistia geumhonensis]MCX5481167.1 GIY-YIG nuclease family protein [Kaistia geumhonensis]MDQ0518228.1 hypothetical protein [Kaistia geumhonensis]